MTTTGDLYLTIAEAIAKEMNQSKAAYTTKTRPELLTLLRHAAKETRVKIGRNVGDAIEAALEHKGLRAFPHINEAPEAVRIIRRGTFLDQILNAFLHPGTITDQQLATLIKKAKQTDLLRK